MTAYSEDKNKFTNWLIGTIGTLILTGLFTINNSLKELTEITGNSKKDIEYIKAKNIEQDIRIDRVEDYFLKPKQIKIQEYVQ
jgi:hypothetical protein